jgi:hypothetical protein
VRKFALACGRSDAVAARDEQPRDRAGNEPDDDQNHDEGDHGALVTALMAKHA